MCYVECIILWLKKILGLATCALFKKRNKPAAPKSLVCIYLKTSSDYFSKPLMAGRCTLLRINQSRHPTAGTRGGKYDAYTSI